MDRPLVLQIEPSIEPDRNLIGGKALSLVTLAQHGATVPPAFVLTTEAYRRWMNGGDDALLVELIAQGIQGLENSTGRRFGGGAGGLIVSVRSGAPISMPGMMDTILNVGLGRLPSGTESFICDARERFLWQFADLVLDLGSPRLTALRAKLEPRHSVQNVNAIEKALADEAVVCGKCWPRSVHEELLAATKAVFSSWESPRAKLYRRIRKIEDSIGTTVTVQRMVFGNRDRQSGSGVAFTRNPTSGEPGLHGEFVMCGQGEEVVAGRVTGGGLAELRAAQPGLFAQLEELSGRLEASFKKAQEIEFTVEQGRLYVLQCRPALLTVRASARVAVEMVNEGRVATHEAVQYARSHGFEPDSDPTGLAVRGGATPVAKGLAVGGGVGVGRVAFEIARADELIRAGEPVVFVAVETSPSLVSIMQRSAALVTMRGGATSHAAVVARELGTPCVVGVGADIDNGRIMVGKGLAAGDWVTIDGDSGEIFEGDVAYLTSRLTAFERTLRRWSANLREPEHQNGESK